MANKPSLEDLGKAFIDIAENKDVWEVDFSLSLFRKRLKILGQKLAEWFKFLDEHIEQKVKEILAELASTKNNLDNKINTSVTSLDSKINDANVSVDAKFKAVLADIKKIKAATQVTENNLEILIKNDQTIVNALKNIFTRLNIQEALDITEIEGGTAVD